MVYTKYVIRGLTTALLVIIGGSNFLPAEELLLPLISRPPNFDSTTQPIAIGRSVYDRSFLIGPLKNLAWDDHTYSTDPSIEARLVAMPSFELGLQGGLRQGRYARHEQLLSGPGPLEDSYALGLFTRSWYGDYLFGTHLRKNIAGGRERVLGEFIAGYEKKLSEKLDLSLGLGTTWTDGDYMSSDYDINLAQSVLSGLPLYTPNSGLKNASLTVSACYQLSDYWSLGAQVGYMRLLEPAAESPIRHEQEAENFVTGFQLQYRLRALTGAKFRNLLRPTCHDY